MAMRSLERTAKRKGLSLSLSLSLSVSLPVKLGFIGSFVHGGGGFFVATSNDRFTTGFSD